MFKNADFIMSDAEPKIMGNQLSHYYILKDMIKNNFGFHKTSNLKDFEALNINDPIESKVQCKEDINDAVCILADNVNPCSLAYLVTLKGANNLVNYFNTVGFLRATDWNYTDYLVSKNINYATKTVLCTGNPDFGSDIFK